MGFCDEIEQDNNNSCSDPYEKLEELEGDRDFIIKNIGRKAYDTMEDFAKQDIQKDYLKIGNLSITSLQALFGPYLNKATPPALSETIDCILRQHRNVMISPPLTFDLRHAPNKKLPKNIFKTNVKTILRKFVKQFPILSPVKLPLGVMVWYVPPKVQSIDLDNLARYIIPFVNEIVQPPINYGNSANSISRYQFIELPRLDSDSVEGYVRLIFDNPFTGNIWRRTDNVIEKWWDGV